MSSLAHFVAGRSPSSNWHKVRRRESHNWEAERESSLVFTICCLQSLRATNVWDPWFLRLETPVLNCDVFGNILGYSIFCLASRSGFHEYLHCFLRLRGQF